MIIILDYINRSMVSRRRKVMVCLRSKWGRLHLELSCQGHTRRGTGENQGGSRETSLRWWKDSRWCWDVGWAIIPWSGMSLVGMRRQILGQWSVLPTGRVQLEMKMNFLLLCFKKIFCFTQIHVYLEKLENTVKQGEGKTPHIHITFCCKLLRLLDDLLGR